jgi:1,4-dihydroxy-2-naphthoate polyprenyltransferase
LQHKISMVKNIIRALRLPFLSASVLSFIFGSLIERSRFNRTGFFLGLMAAAFTHLSANLINDYADSQSGVDGQDINFYNFFGGSKLIQENVFSEKFYLRLALFFAFLAGATVVLLALVLKTFFVVGIYLAVIFLSWSYSHGLLRFSYRRVGEAFIFLLFGPALVMGGYFIQTGIFPDLKSFMLSLPCGFLTTNILFSNEVPDFESDVKGGKFTWVSLTRPQHAYLLYLGLLSAAFLAIAAAVALRYLSALALLAFVFIIPGLKAAGILKKFHGQKVKLIESSKLTIMTQAMVSLVLILAVLL